MTAKTENRANDRRAGFTLVELMVSLFIVGIVMMGWWRIMNATSPYREAQRRAAVEIASGMLDIFPRQEADDAAEEILWETFSSPQQYKVNTDGKFSKDSSGERQRFPSEWFPAESPVRYTLDLEQGVGVKQWTIRSESVITVWLVVKLYDSEDGNSHPNPFTILKQVASAKYVPPF